jgi:hypothetical protein
MESRDGGSPFLQLLSVEQGSEKDVDKIFTDYIDINDINNDIRLRLPMKFCYKDILFIYSHVLPNFYGICHGVAFSCDSLDSIEYNSFNVENVNTIPKDTMKFTVRKTNQPEIYEIQKKTGVVEILYIPTLSIAKKMYSLIKNSNEIVIPCSFDLNRQRWIPVL